jgi:hypothetical protein
MQRFISGSSLPYGNPVVAGRPAFTLARSGKKAEKPLGKIFAKMPFRALFFAMLCGLRSSKAHHARTEVLV